MKSRLRLTEPRMHNIGNTMLTQLIFYGFSTLLLMTALAVIVSRNPVRSALFLVLCFFASAVLWILLEAEFLALILIVVYVGAVMTLFLFVVMMIDIDLAELKKGFVKYLPIGALVLAAMVALMILVISKEHFAYLQAAMPTAAPHDYSNLKDLGSVLYTEHVYSFELASVLLLIAIIASISLTYRGPRQRKKQNINAQVKVSKEDRLRIVKIAAATPGAGGNPTPGTSPNAASETKVDNNPSSEPGE